MADFRPTHYLQRIPPEGRRRGNVRDDPRLANIPVRLEPDAKGYGPVFDDTGVKVADARRPVPPEREDVFVVGGATPGEYRLRIAKQEGEYRAGRGGVRFSRRIVPFDAKYTSTDTDAETLRDGLLAAIGSMNLAGFDVSATTHDGNPAIRVHARQPFETSVFAQPSADVSTVKLVDERAKKGGWKVDIDLPEGWAFQVVESEETRLERTGGI